MGSVLFYLKLWLNVDSEVTPRAKYYFYFCTYSEGWDGLGWLYCPTIDCVMNLREIISPCKKQILI